MPVTQAQYAEFVAAGHAPRARDRRGDVEGAGLRAGLRDRGRAVRVARRPPARGPRGSSGRARDLDRGRALLRVARRAARGARVGCRRGPSSRRPRAATPGSRIRGATRSSRPSSTARSRGPRDTTPVGTFIEGASPYGVLDLAGNVFQWTAIADRRRRDDGQGLGVGGLRAASGAAPRATAGRGPRAT